MKWIYNFKIKTKLLTGFFIVILITGIMGYTGIKNIQDVRTKYNILFEDFGVPLGDIGKACRAFEQNRSNMRQIILESDTLKMDKIVSDVKDKDRITEEELDKFAKSIRTDKSKTDYNKLRLQIDQYAKVRDKVTSLALINKNQEAIDIMNSEAIPIAKDVSDTFTSIVDNEINTGRIHSDEYSSFTDNTVRSMMVILFIAITMALVIAMLLSSIIGKPIKILMETMTKGANGEELKTADLEGKDEICEMSKAYGYLIKKIKEQIWSNEGKTKLNECISGDLLLTEFTQKTVSFLSNYLNGGSAAFYLYNEAESNLKLFGSYAFTERDRSSSILEVGEGIVGQVVIEKQPILLKNIKRGEAMITTGLFSETPLNTFAFPLIYENKTLGVIELASFEPFDHLKQQFITETSNTISTNLYVLFQSEKVKELLKAANEARQEAEVANIELKLRAEELEKMNIQMEEQQQILQQQSEELQQSNTQMEEQQQILQQQSEELQQTNTQLEEQQQALQQQSEIVRQNNDSLLQAQKELENRSKELETSNNYKSQFLANMSHELRTPLNSIILLSKLLLRSSTSVMPEKDIEKIGIINRCGTELLRLINDVLDLSKLEAGKIQLNSTIFSTLKLAQEFKDIFSSIADEKGIEFICEDKLNINLKSDRERISQIISNFLSNAFKFTEKGTVYLSIAHAESEKWPIAISVKDTGIGIPEEKKQKIFEAFEQMDGSISRKYGGTGLGLYISEEISALLNGKIKVISEEGSGSEFILLLPKEVCEIEEHTSIRKEKRFKYVLVVEDEETQRNAIKELIETEEIKVLEASEEEEAIEIIEKYSIEVVIVDLQLKKGSGVVLCNNIKHHNINIPIIIYTSKDIFVDLETENELKKYADSIIIKTVNSIDRLQDEILIYLYSKNTNKKENVYLYNKLQNIKIDGIRNKHILIVDDDPKNIFVLAAALEDCGANAIEAENGLDALEKIETQAVDLILMDIMMPVMDGYECIKRIRSMDKYKKIPIIALTAKALKGDREKCIEAGANDYISKPVDYDVLINLINAWISK